jgi:hypothetical protein
MVEDDRFGLLLQHLTELLCKGGRLTGATVRVEVERLDWRLRLAAENGNWDRERDDPFAA